LEGTPRVAPVRWLEALHADAWYAGIAQDALS
jgi:hypothetical protein